MISTMNSSASSSTAPSTSVSLLYEIMKQLHALAKPPPPMLLSRLPPTGASTDNSNTKEKGAAQPTTPPQVSTLPAAQPEAELPIDIEKLARIKEAYFGPADSPELEEFLLMYLETIQICKHEYSTMEGSIQEVVRTIKDQQAKANKKKKRKRKNLSDQSKNLLKKWLADHWFHPYPTNEEKLMLCEQTGITLHSLNHWFINARRRNVLTYALSGNPATEREINAQ